MGFPVISDNPAIQAHYITARKQGTSHVLAEMFATGDGPCLVTDATFMADTANGKQFQDKKLLGDKYASIAKAHGQSITGKKYLSSLAEFPGDPRAWVNGRGDVARRCEEMGWECQGSVKVKGREFPPDVHPELAPDIVNDRVRDIVENAPEPMKPREVADLTEKVHNQLKPQKKK